MPYTLCLNHPYPISDSAHDLVSHTLRPTSDQPVSVSHDGTIVSRYGDAIWDMTPYTHRITRFRFDFNDFPDNRAVSDANSELYKRVMYWVLFGTGLSLSIATILNLYAAFRTIWMFCGQNGIVASELCMSPLAQEQFVMYVGKHQQKVMTSLLRKVYIDRDLLGFNILTPTFIDKLSGLSRNSSFSQTPCIPDRIFFYVVNRCSDVIEGYLKHEENFRRLYAMCASASFKVRSLDKPGSVYARVYQRREAGKRINVGALEYYFGAPFDYWLEELDLKEVIADLIQPVAPYIVGPRTLGAYLTFTALASRILVCALTGMREQEHRLLKLDCYEQRNDPLLGTIHLVKGETRKTVKQRYAYWISCDLTERAIRAARSISVLRSEHANAFRSKHNHERPYQSNLLFGRSSDPWFGLDRHTHAEKINPLTTKAGALGNLIDSAENRLLDSLEMTITSEDLEQALRLSPDLDREKYVVGRPWPVAWHQFRRTIVCLALGSGVSLPAMAWQLKHAGPAMTMYYGRNYFDLPCDSTLKKEFVEAQLDALEVKGRDIRSDDYVPVLAGHTPQLVRLLSQNDSKTIRKLAQDGKVSIRHTAIGVCTNSEPCAFGGWEHVTECIKCAHALASKRSLGRLQRMRGVIDDDIAICSRGDSRLRSSLEAQRDAVDSAIALITRGSDNYAV